jgi:hypothetical protein
MSLGLTWAERMVGWRLGFALSAQPSEQPSVQSWAERLVGRRLGFALLVQPSVQSSVRVLGERLE